MFLIYILIFATLGWQVFQLGRHPSSRALPRVVLTVGLAVLSVVIVVYGILS